MRDIEQVIVLILTDVYKRYHLMVVVIISIIIIAASRFSASSELTELVQPVGKHLNATCYANRHRYQNIWKDI